LHPNNFNRDSNFMLSQAWYALINILKKLSNTQMKRSREDKEQEMKRHQVQTEAGGGATMTEDGHSTDDG
jgi:hypothetical protein